MLVILRKLSMLSAMDQVSTNLHVVIALNIPESHTFLVNYVPLTFILIVLILPILIMITPVGFVIIASQEYVTMNFPSRMVPLLILIVRWLKVSRLRISIQEGFAIKLITLSVLLHQNNIDILCLTETWLDCNINDSDVTIQGYNLCRLDRTKQDILNMVVFYAI